MALGQDKTWDEKEALEYFQSNKTENDENMLFVSAVKRWGLVDLMKRASELLADKTGQNTQY
jgi:hypothetical protein